MVVWLVGALLVCVDSFVFWVVGVLAVGLVWLVGGALGLFVWWFLFFLLVDWWVSVYFRDEPARATMSMSP